MLNKITIQPHITEKSMQLVSKKKYTFLVQSSANKHTIAKMINNIYKVTPLNVKIINKKGKNVMFRQKYKGKKTDVKKAIVTLSEKDSIKDFAIKE